MTIIEARLRELFSIIEKDLSSRAQQSQKLCPAGVVITGAGSLMPGMDRLAADVFGVPARLGENPRWVRDELRGPGFSTVLGLMHYALKDPARPSYSRAKTQRRWFNPMARWLGLGARSN
ncbi:MAG: hypothetical protein B7X06_04330 [Verrucomicrobia bacterium 21-51-4]|nr:MAG: hypothetical protein B7X06_04330 [Verrucomicrobia bacterium 21-51-4]HQU09117.1 hypothetical protein [Opitutales bacterium]